MRVLVVQLLAKGVRRPRIECRGDSATIGTLTVEDVAMGTCEGRPLRMASRWERYGSASRRPIVSPLIDVQLLRVTPRGMLLRGFQISTRESSPVQHAQE